MEIEFYLLKSRGISGEWRGKGESQKPFGG
jgi:hypothetical protein